MRAFRGLNNVSDPMRLGLEWLAQADNVNISDTGAMSVRDGYTSSISATISAAYTTRDFSRFYYVSNGTLKTFEGATLATGLGTAKMFWTEVNRNVYYNNGTDRGIIAPDNRVLPWEWTTPAAPTLAAVAGNLSAGTYQVRCTFTLADGRETGADDAVSITLGENQALSISNIHRVSGSTTNVYIAPANSTVFQLARAASPAAFVWDQPNDSLGIDLLTSFLDPIPRSATVIAAWKGRIYAAMYMQATHQTAVWRSMPLGYHLFNLNSDFFMVPGRVQCLAPHEKGLVVGTDDKVFVYSEQSFEEIADYGVVPGYPWAYDGDDILLWTKRGACRLLPMRNLIIDRVSVPPGTHAGAAVIADDGQKRFVVALKQGDLAFNPRN